MFKYGYVTINKHHVKKPKKEKKKYENLIQKIYKKNDTLRNNVRNIVRTTLVKVSSFNVIYSCYIIHSYQSKSMKQKVKNMV